MPVNVTCSLNKSLLADLLNIHYGLTIDCRLWFWSLVHFQHPLLVQVVGNPFYTYIFLSFLSYIICIYKYINTFLFSLSKRTAINELVNNLPLILLSCLLSITQALQTEREKLTGIPPLLYMSWLWLGASADGMQLWGNDSSKCWIFNRSQHN